MKVRHDGNEVAFTSNNLHADGNPYSRHSCNYNFIPVNVERNPADISDYFWYVCIQFYYETTGGFHCQFHFAQ